MEIKINKKKKDAKILKAWIRFIYVDGDNMPIKKEKKKRNKLVTPTKGDTMRRLNDNAIKSGGFRKTPKRDIPVNCIKLRGESG